MRHLAIKGAVAVVLAAAVIGQPSLASATAIAGPACDFNHDNRSDLAVGAPGESVGILNSAGSVNVLYGSAAGITSTGNVLLNQASPGVNGVAESGDSFGHAVACGDFNDDGFSDRIGFPLGTRVHVTNDALAHNPLWRIDMSGIEGGDEYQIAAARDGVIKYIVDTNFEPTDNNNYVWIEHADGEWTKYTHVKTNSVTALGHQVGDFVTAGTVLGWEGQVGRASGDHLHFEVAVPDDLANPITSGGFVRGTNRIPVICGIPGNALFRGEDYTVASC